jgi:YggT family protein
MFTDAFDFLIRTILELLMMLFLLRFFMQYFKAPFGNPLGVMVIALTDFAVKPMRKLVPSLKKIDLSTLLLALITQFILQFSVLWLKNYPLSLAGQNAWFGLIGLSIVGTVRITLDVFFYILLLQAILSWVNPFSPIAGVLNALTKPMLDPIRRIVPMPAGIDFSPIIALILIQMLEKSFIRAFEVQLHSLF